MQIYAFDWAEKKALTVYDAQTKKVKEVANTIEAFEKFLAKLKTPATLLFEQGGGDTFKIMAYRAGHVVGLVDPKKVKVYRDAQGIAKSDANDARAIYDYFINQGGGATTALSERIMPQMPPAKAKKGGGAGRTMSKRIVCDLPAPFSIFTEADAEMAEIKILYREHEKIKVSMVREKNKLRAFALKFEIARVAGDAVGKIRKEAKIEIASKEKRLALLKKELAKKVEPFPVWTHYKDVKGIGPTIVAGLIGELGAREFSRGGLKHYSGMVKKYTKKIGHYHSVNNPDGGHASKNNHIKAVLFQFADCIIKHRTPKWRPLYDSMKKYYAKKHKDWRPGKVDAHAKKFIETKFLEEFYCNLRGGAKSILSTRIGNIMPAPL